MTPDGDPAVDGMVEEMTPPAAGAPGRFVHTWHIRYDEELAAEPPGRVEWTVESAGEGLTRVRLVHGDLAGSPLTWSNVKDGWVWVLDSLKSALETGSGLPRRTVDPAAASEREDGEGGWHRRQGIVANNSCWELIERSGPHAGRRRGVAPPCLRRGLPLAAGRGGHRGP